MHDLDTSPAPAAGPTSFLPVDDGVWVAHHGHSYGGYIRRGAGRFSAFNPHSVRVGRYRSLSDAKAALAAAPAAR